MRVSGHTQLLVPAVNSVDLQSPILTDCCNRKEIAFYNVDSGFDMPDYSLYGK